MVKKPVTQWKRKKIMNDWLQKFNTAERNYKGLGHMERFNICLNDSWE